MTTDLDRLHKVFAMGDPGRGEGRTFLDCHTVAGALESTEEDGVICLVPKYNRIDNIMVQMVHFVFLEHGIRFDEMCSQTLFTLFLPGGFKKYVRFAVAEDETMDNLYLIGNIWPIVNFTEYEEEEEE